MKVISILFKETPHKTKINYLIKKYGAIQKTVNRVEIPEDRYNLYEMQEFYATFDYKVIEEIKEYKS